MTGFARQLKDIARRGARRLGLRDSLPRYDDREFTNYVWRKRQALNLRAGSIEALTIGSSHGDYGPDPARFPHSYNAALTSCDLHTSWHLLANVSPLLTNLERLFVFYSVFSPGHSLIETGERYRAVAYRHFFGVPYQNADRIDRRSEANSLRQFTQATPDPIDPEYAGFDPGKPFFTATTARDRASAHLRENNRLPSQNDYLERVIDHARESGIALFVVIPPFRSDYVHYLPPRSQLFRQLDGLSGGFELVDLYGSPQFDDSDMGDADHLNPRGAAKLTRLLHGCRPR